METPASLRDRLAVLNDALPALAGLREAFHQAQGSELAGLVTLLDTLASQAAQSRTAAVAEALQRGEIDSTMNGWVREHAPSLRQGGFGQTASLVVEATGGGPLWSKDAGLDPDSPLGIVWGATHAVTPPPAEPEPSQPTETEAEASPDAVSAAETEDEDHETLLIAPLNVGNAMAVLREVKHLKDRLEPALLPTVTRELVKLCLEWGPAHMRKLRPHLIAKYGKAGELDDLHDKLAKGAYLSSPQIESGGLTEYRMALTPTQAATLEAAIGPLAGPRPNPETGERDLRPAGQRRAEALIEICQRATALHADNISDGPTGAYAALHLTMGLADLRQLAGCTEDLPGSAFSVPLQPGTPSHSLGGAGEVLATCAEGTLLSPETLRRMCCEANLIPHVLGSRGEILDQGREVRLFQRAQRRALLRRDRHCTYPGCDRPGAWTRAHHVLHWLDGGQSSPDNAALLCERHHTIVHARRLWADVRTSADKDGRHVVWDLTDGSYDRELARQQRERSTNDPPPLTPARLETLRLALISKDLADRDAAAHLLGLYDPDDPELDPDEEPLPIHDPLIWDELTGHWLDPVPAA